MLHRRARCAFTSCYSALLCCCVLVPQGTPCVAAHSVVRALYGAFAGKLYSVKRLSDGTVADIGVLEAGGLANAAVQDAFCRATSCTIERIFDQSPRGNHIAPPSSSGGRSYQCPAAGCLPVNASKGAHTLGGRHVWSAVFEGGMGYRNNTSSGVATGDQPQSIYMVASGRCGSALPLRVRRGRVERCAMPGKEAHPWCTCLCAICRHPLQ
jgi:hypothetical protein